MFPIQFETSKLASVIDMGIGSRVAIDFVDELGPMEGLLVGDAAHGFILVLSENRTTDTYPAREFRVNAGALHQYVYVSESATKYLAELESGGVLPVVSRGTQRSVPIGRVKREKRALLRLVLENGVSATLQAADSVHVLGAGPTCVLGVRPGDDIAFLSCALGATHLGERMASHVKET